MFRKISVRHTTAMMLAAVTVVTAHGFQIIYLPPIQTARDADALYRAGCRRLEAGDTSDAIELLHNRSSV